MLTGRTTESSQINWHSCTFAVSLNNIDLKVQRTKKNQKNSLFFRWNCLRFELERKIDCQVYPKLETMWILSLCAFLFSKKKMEKRDAHNKNCYELALHNVIRFQIRSLVILLSFHFYSVVFADESVDRIKFNEIRGEKNNSPVFIHKISQIHTFPPFFGGKCLNPRNAMRKEWNNVKCKKKNGCYVCFIWNRAFCV